MVSENLPLDTLIPDKPSGTLPLLVRMPDGQHTQVNVPTSATVDDVATEIARDHPTTSEYFKLSFSNSDLDPTASLLDTGIVDAYNHAGSLLQLISNSSTNPDTRAAAVESTCAVVERISNGVTNMQALCEAAMNGNLPNGIQPLDKNQSQNHNIDTQDDDPNQFQSDIPQESPPTPSQLARSLTRRLPNLFAPSSNQELNNISLDHNHSNKDQSNNRQATLGRQQSQLLLQPSISAIRDARRRARTATPSGNQSNNPGLDSNAANAYTIGGSTNTMPLPTDFTGMPNSPRTQALLITNSGKSTWLEDIMTTWEVGAVRESGVLNDSKQGQEISTYFNELEAQAERELESEKIAEQDQGETLHPGDSSDEEEEEEPAKQQPQNVQPTNNQSVNTATRTLAGQVVSKAGGEKPSMNGTTTADAQMNDTGMKTEKNGPGQTASQTIQRPTMVIQKQNMATQSNNGNQMQNVSRQHALVGMNNQIPITAAQLNQFKMSTQSQQLIHHRQIQGQLQIPPVTAPYKFISPSASTTPLSISTISPTSSTGVPSSAREWAVMSDPTRNPAKLAPAPGEPSPTASAALANGTLNSMFPTVAGVPTSSWHNQAPTPGPKKRGRKRKYPQLTDEERALVRKEQNRESAKLSRVRRKAIAAEYEERLSSVINENSHLRKQVAGLNDRLAYLQSLLTVSVRCEPSSVNQAHRPGQSNIGQARKQY